MPQLPSIVSTISMLDIRTRDCWLHVLINNGNRGF